MLEDLSLCAFGSAESNAVLDLQLQNLKKEGAIIFYDAHLPTNISLLLYTVENLLTASTFPDFTNLGFNILHIIQNFESRTTADFFNDLSGYQNEHLLISFLGQFYIKHAEGLIISYSNDKFVPGSGPQVFRSKVDCLRTGLFRVIKILSTVQTHQGESLIVEDIYDLAILAIKSGNFEVSKEIVIHRW